jgi:hypothetical protein
MAVRACSVMDPNVFCCACLFGYVLFMAVYTLPGNENEVMVVRLYFTVHTCCELRTFLDISLQNGSLFSSKQFSSASLFVYG